jgi:hypothetical protein
MATLRARLAAAALAAILPVACAAPDDPNAARVPPDAALPHANGHGAAPGDPVDDDVAYLGQLGLVRGHLLVGIELYRRGAFEAARSHMKHPSDELYSGLVPAFAARGTTGFASELQRLAVLVEGAGTRTDIEAAYTTLLAAMARNEAAVRTTPAWTPGLELRVVAYLVRTAGDEYEEGVQDGRVVTPHEYQDAYGFVQVAQGLIDGLHAEGRAADAAARARAALARLAGAWPDLPEPEGRVDMSHEAFGEAAAAIEAAADEVA